MQNIKITKRGSHLHTRSPLIVIFLAVSLLLLLVVSGCRSAQPDLTYGKRYDGVLVGNFESGELGQAFGDKIAEELVSRGVVNVSRSENYLSGSVVVVTGAIGREDEGNAGRRIKFGHGVGSAHFEATVVFRDQATGDLIGLKEIDEQSQIMGPDAAAHASLEQIMADAAKEVATEVERFLR